MLAKLCSSCSRLLSSDVVQCPCGEKGLVGIIIPGHQEWPFAKEESRGEKTGKTFTVQSNETPRKGEKEVSNRLILLGVSVGIVVLAVIVGCFTDTTPQEFLNMLAQAIAGLGG